MVKTAKKTGSFSAAPAPSRPKLGVTSTSQVSKSKAKTKATSKAKPRVPKDAVPIPRPGGKTRFGMPFVKKGESQAWYKNVKLSGYIPEQAIDDTKLAQKCRAIRDAIHEMKWDSIFESPGHANLDLVSEFYANWDPKEAWRDDDMVQVRGHKVKLNATALCNFLRVDDHDTEELRDFIRKPDYIAMRDTLCGKDSAHMWERSEDTGRHKCMIFSHFQKKARVWMKLINARIQPSGHFTTVTKTRACMIYFFMIGTPVNIGYYMLKLMRRIRLKKKCHRLFFCNILTRYLEKEGVPTDEVGDRIVPDIEKKLDVAAVKGVVASAPAKFTSEEWRDTDANLTARHYLMTEFLAKEAGMDMQALDRAVPLLESSKRLLGMTQKVVIPPEEDENTDSDIVAKDMSSDEDESGDEEEGIEEEESEEEARTPLHRPGGSVKRKADTPAHAEREDADDTADAT